MVTTPFKTNPHRAVSFSESGVKSALERAGCLEVETKYDGVRVNIPVWPTGYTEWLSRESKPLPALSYLDGESDDDWQYFVQQCGFGDLGLMIDGEVMVKGVDFNTSSGLIRTKWLKKNNFMYDTRPKVEWVKATREPFMLDKSNIKVVVYAVVPLDIIKDPKQEGPIHSLTRLRTEATVAVLKQHFPQIEWVLAESTTVFDLESLNSLYDEERARGGEGLIVKDPLGHYKRGKKSGQWKMKPDEDIDGTVCGLMWGTQGLKNEGKVIGFEVLLEDGMVVRAGNITEDLMDEFTETVNCARNCSGSSGEDIYNGYQVEVSYMERFPDGSLRHPSFKCFRGTEDNPKVKS